MKHKSTYEIFITFSLFMLAFIVRSYKVESGNFVTWDEAHFGKFSGKYLTRSFYFDVHPPLGKMLTAFSGWLYDQPVNFKFESSSPYPSDFDFSGMRRFHAFVSSFTPMFSFLILREMKFSKFRSIFLTLLFIFENGFTSIGRLILLDSYMLSFTSCVAYFLTRLFFRDFRTIDLFYLGVSLGMVLSVKWIGCLTTAFVGLLVIREILRQAASKHSLRKVIWNFVRCALCLIVLPVLFYVLLFLVHFKIVNRSSGDDGHMSSIFQASLEGNNHIKNRKFVTFGTRVTIKSQVQGGGYLHSHDHTYPDSKSYQVTTYSHKDENNSWVFQKVTDKIEDALFVEDGDEIVLYHLETQRYLSIENTNDNKDDVKDPRDDDNKDSRDDDKNNDTKYNIKQPPNRPLDLRASATPKPLSYKNVFILEIHKDLRKSESRLKSLSTLFRIRHKDTGAYLAVTGEKYPSWAFEQGEVVAIENKNKKNESTGNESTRNESTRNESTYWNIEENTSDKVNEEINPVYSEMYKNLFLRNFIEHNIVMYKTNKSFIQDEDLEPERIVSRPYEWPILRRGLRMCSWDKKALKFYMFGNPLVWYTATLCVVLAPLKFIYRLLRYQRHRLVYRERLDGEGFNGKRLDDKRLDGKRFDGKRLDGKVSGNQNSTKMHKQNTNKFSIDSEGFIIFLSFGGWCFHYLPFYLVGRVLYFHHYYPALFFSIFSIGYMTKDIKKKYLKVYVLACILSYLLYSGLTYGLLKGDFISKLRIISTWDY